MTTPGRGALAGLAAGASVAAAGELGTAVAGLPNPGYRIFEAVSGALPGQVVSYGIDRMVTAIRALGVGPTDRAAKAVERGLAEVSLLALSCLAGMVLAGGLARARGPRSRLAVAGGFAAALVLAGALLVPRRGEAGLTSFAWTSALAAAWTAIATMLAPGDAVAPRRGRRTALQALTASAALMVWALIVARLRRAGRPAPAASSPAPRGGAALGGAPSGERLPPVPGTRAELTRNADFYRIDIDLTPPVVDERTWRLRVGGLVDRPATFTLEALRARPAVTQPITLECISNPVGGDLISTSLWTGFTLWELLRDVGLRPEARAIFIEAVDGFYETVELADARDLRTLLVYAMNGQPLPAAHGFPLRIFVPDRYGMKQPKWIHGLTAVDAWRPGYWVERGWSKQAIPRTTSVIDVARTGNTARGTAVLGGIAYAGARGVSRVEAQVDDGPWQAAALRVPPLGPLTWVEWRAELACPPGEHRFRVRAYDGAGKPQPVQERPPHPDGATGLYRRHALIG